MHINKQQKMGKKKSGDKGKTNCAWSVKQSAAFMKNIMCGTVNPWVQFLPLKPQNDLSVLPSRKTETSSADSQPGMEESEHMAPLWSPARERRSTPIVELTFRHS